MHILANSPASASQKLDRLRHALLAFFSYLIDMSKIDCGAIPCSLLKLHIFRASYNKRLPFASGWAAKVDCWETKPSTN